MKNYKTLKFLNIQRCSNKYFEGTSYQNLIQKDFILWNRINKKKKNYNRNTAYQQLKKAMRFQSIQNNKIYKLYRQDELQRLRKRIQQIKTRKNQHMGSKQKHLLPYISAGFGFSQQKKRQIEKQNQRLQKKLQKVKNTRSAYYLGNLTTISSSPDKKLKKIKMCNTVTNRSCDNLLLPMMQSERLAMKQVQKKTMEEHKLSTARPNNFRKEIMKIYTQTIQDKNKKVL